MVQIRSARGDHFGPRVNADSAILSGQINAVELDCEFLFAKLPIGVVQHDDLGHIVAANPAAMDILGLRMDQMRGLSAFDPTWRSVHEDGSPFPGVDHPAMVALRTGRGVSDVVMGVYNPKSAQRRWIRISAIPLLNDKHPPVAGALAFFEDVTAQKAAEQQANIHLSQLRSALASMSDSFLLTDAGGHFLEINEAFARFHRFPSAAECVRTRNDYARLIEVRTPDGALLLPDQWLLARALRGESGTDQELELRRTDSGECWLGSFNYAPVRNADDGIIGTVVTGRDVTEARRVQQALQLSEDKYRQAFQLTPDAMNINRREDGLYVSINHGFTRIMGYEEADVIGRTSLEINIWCDPADRATLVRLLQSEGRVNNYEARFRAKDGQVRTGLMSAALIQVDGAAHILSITRDITAQRLADAELRIAATAFESQVGILVTGSDEAILRVNRRFSEITGYQAHEVIGRSPRLLQSGRHDKAFFAAVWRELISKGCWEGEIWNRRKNGNIYPIWLNITAVQDEQQRTTQYVGTFTDASARKAAEDQINTLAFYDPLTRLPNRRLLMDRLDVALATSVRHRRYGALLFLDLDNFKNINDTAGHHSGDYVIEQAAARLSRCVREGDTVARLGGDEFVVMLEDLDNNAVDAASQSESIAEKIRLALNQTYDLACGQFHSTCSVGITLFGGGGHKEATDEPMKRADLAMYQAKAAGRNTTRFFDPEMQAAVSARSSLEMDIRVALENTQFLLYYQPQISAHGVVLGVEALVRWQHPERGLVPPDEFIPLAEETGLILQLGEWVLRTACAQLQTWSDMPRFATLSLAVNVSARQFHQRDFVSMVDRVLTETGAKANRLKLELTESMLVSEVDMMIEHMLALKARGVGFSLDDFGTGYSSLAYLKRLPLDQLKIDQSFVRNILTDPSDTKIARTVIVLAESLGLDVIAEGVETPAQRECLLDQGCRNYQGYLFSRPLPLEVFEQFVVNRVPGHVQP